MITISEYLINKTNKKQIQQIRINDISLKSLYDKFAESGINREFEDIEETIKRYDFLIKKNDELKQLIKYLADVAETHINGNDKYNYVAINLHNNISFPQGKSYEIILRFDDIQEWRITSYENYSFIGFTWRDKHQGWKMDVSGKYGKPNELTSWSKSSDYYFGITKDSVDAVINHSNNFLKDIP